MSGPSYLNSVNLKQDSDFPYLVLEVINDESYPRNPGFQVMHWHEDLQFIYVLEGEIEVVTLSERVRLRRGDGIFLNRNVVHLVRKVTACHYKSFLFPERFLKFYPGSPAERMVEQIVGRPELPIRAIREEDGSVTRLLQKLSRMEEGKTTWYPLRGADDPLPALARLQPDRFHPGKAAPGQRRRGTGGGLFALYRPALLLRGHAGRPGRQRQRQQVRMSSLLQDRSALHALPVPHGVSAGQSRRTAAPDG